MTTPSPATLLGTPVTGADQPSEQAPLLAPGQYTDTLANSDLSVTDNSGTIKYYTVPVKSGVRLYVSVNIVPPDSSATDIEGFGTDADLLRDDRCIPEPGTVGGVVPAVCIVITPPRDYRGPRIG